MFSCGPWRRSRNIRVVPSKIITTPIFGLDNAGKSTLLLRLQNDPGNKVRPTWGFVNSYILIGDTTLRLYDIGGHEKIRGIWKNYYAEAHGFVFVVDGSNARTIDESRDSLHALYSLPRCYGKPLLIVLTRIDSPDYMGYTALIERLNIDALRKMSISNSHDLENSHITVSEVNCTFVARHGQKIDPLITTGVSRFVNTVLQHLVNLEDRIRVDTTAQRLEYLAEQQAKQKRVDEFHSEVEMSNPLGLNYSDDSTDEEQEESTLTTSRSQLPVVNTRHSEQISPHRTSQVKNERVVIIECVSTLYTYADFVQKHLSGVSTTSVWPIANKTIMPEQSKELSQLQMNQQRYHLLTQHLPSQLQSLLTDIAVNCSSNKEENTSQVDSDLQQKIEQWTTMKRERGVSFNQTLMTTREYKNPHMYRKLVEFLDLNEHGTNYPTDIFDLSTLPAQAYYNELDKAQREKSQSAVERQTNRTQIQFVPPMQSKTNDTTSY